MYSVLRLSSTGVFSKIGLPSVGRRTRLNHEVFNRKNVRSFHSNSWMFDKPFDKILIANRGEIACRVMKSANKLDVKTVAVYSEPDMNAKHVAMADEAVHIGPAQSNESYLVIEKIVKACLDTGAQAVHPGYGFLSENNSFVTELEKNNISFIGPGSRAISAMGDKIESKKIAKEAGVNVIPGFMGEVDSLEDAIILANEVGYPVMIKASAGGGGKGMRVAWNDEEAAEGYRLSKQEAMSSFGDDRLLIERFIDKPRHVEIQVLCDKHGNNLYLNERECSIQRRNQKVVEEAPSPFLTPELRKEMGEQAVALCKAVDYVSAGTVEFLVDSNRNFYFLEMNTRLQVEHPVTEFITGVDLVEWMIKIAAGEKLTLSQSDIGINGWAVESRVYAEDPLRDFLPSIGKLQQYKEPQRNDEEGVVRVDSGVTEGSEISIFYDPLISKLITYGQTRQAALTTMLGALDTYIIRGVNHNVSFLRDVYTNPRFVKGDFSTNFIPEEYPDGFSGHVLTEKEFNQLTVIAAGLHRLRDYRDFTVGEENMAEIAPIGELVVKLQSPPGMVIESEEESAEKNEDSRDILSHVLVQSLSSSGQIFRVYVGDEENNYTISFEEYQIDSPVIWAEIDDKMVCAQLLNVTDLGFDIQYCGTNYHMDVMDMDEYLLHKHMKPPVTINTNNFLISPMAGTLISVNASAGDQVVLGGELAVVEAMKMQNVLRAPRDGVVKKINANPGDALSLDDIIVEFEE